MSGPIQPPLRKNPLAGVMEGLTVAPDERQKDQSTHAREEVHPPTHGEDWDQPWSPPSNLDAPTPRPGMAQRWVRTHIGAVDDVQNVQKQFREGWRPRRADTVEPGFPTPSIGEGQYAGVIGIHGMILCEMPIKRLEQRSQYYRDAANTQMGAVQADLQAQNHPAIGPISQQRRTEVTRGKRRPAVQTSLAEAGDSNE